VSNQVNLDEVRALLEGSSREEILKYIRKLMPVEEKAKRQTIKTEHGKPMSYTTVIKSYRCLGCGSRFTRKYMLSKGEDVVYLDPDGVVHAVKVTGKAGEVVVPAIISKCSNCYCMAKVWKREELEARFIALLNSSTFKEIAIYYLTIKEAKDAEDYFSRIRTYSPRPNKEALSEVRHEGGESCSPHCVCRQTSFDYTVPKVYYPLVVVGQLAGI
jgi:hypothetical protein